MASAERTHKVKSLFKKCTECKFGIIRDQGYSNYTVEGNTFNCAKGLHPAAPYDNFYGQTKENYQAEVCTGYAPGENFQIDVEEEALLDLTPEQEELLKLEKLSKLLLDQPDS
jgi:hypothetical protein